MKPIQFSNYATQQQNIVGSLKDVITEGEKQGFKLTKPKGAPSIVGLSKAGNPQIMFINAEGRPVFLRISAELDAALTAGEKVKLLDAPVYDIELNPALMKTPTPGARMLVVGMTGTLDYEVVDTAKIEELFSSYAKPEPAEKE